MRSIPDTLAAKVRLLQQTCAAGADPRLSAIISRHVIPIVDFSMFQTASVGLAGATRATVAVRRPSPRARADLIYTAAIAGGNAQVYVGAFDGYRPPAAWTPALTINGAVDVALAFEGIYTGVGKRIEFSTIGEPWVFWIDLAGVLYGKRVTDAGAGAELATDAAALSAIMGPGNVSLTVTDGLVLAWATITGAVLTRQYLDGVWTDSALHSSMPAGAVDIALIRTWDYRLSMMLQTNDGKVWLINGNSQISGNANMETIEVAGVALAVQEYQTIPNDTQELETIEAADVALSTGVYNDMTPALQRVEQVDDGGNWGIVLRLIYDRPIYNISGNASAYVLLAGGSFSGSVIVYDPADTDMKALLLTMEDFNNAAAEATLQYTQGTIDNGPGMALLPNHQAAITLINLVPSTPPAVLSIVAVDNTTIDIQFDAPISSVDIGANAAALTITGFEPAYSPGGALLPTTYVISAVAFKPGVDDTIRITLTYAGRLLHPQGNVTVAYVAALGNVKNAAGTLAISSFSTAFDPDEANLVLFIKPHDPENISIEALALTCDVNAVTYQDIQSGDENIQVSDVALTMAVYDTSLNPV